MTTEVHSLVIGSNETLVVQLYDIASDTGSNGIDLTGISSVVVKAKNPATGTTKTLTGAVLGTPTDGKFSINSLTSDWSEVGVWTLQIKYTDATGKTRIYPSEGNQLKVKVSEAN